MFHEIAFICLTISNWRIHCICASLINEVTVRTSLPVTGSHDVICQTATITSDNYSRKTDTHRQTDTYRHKHRQTHTHTHTHRQIHIDRQTDSMPWQYNTARPTVSMYVSCFVYTVTVTMVSLTKMLLRQHFNVVNVTGVNIEQQFSKTGDDFCYHGCCQVNIEQQFSKTGDDFCYHGCCQQ